MTVVQYVNRAAPMPIDPAVALLGEPEGAAFDFINGKAWIVDKKNPANTMLRNIGDVLTNPGASATKLLRRKSGLLESAPWWENEFDLAGSPMGMRVEAQRTNAFQRSQRFNAGFWGFSNALAGAPEFLAPDGTMTASKLTESDSAGQHYIRATFGNAVNAGEAFKFHVKARERKIVHIQQLGGSGGVWASGSPGAPNVKLDLQSGTVLSSGAGTSRWEVNRLADGWFEVNLGSPTSAITTTIGMGVSICDDTGAVSYTGDGVSGVEIWGFQREAGVAFPTSYIPTPDGGGAVTRAADQPQISTGFLPYNPAAGTLILDGMSYDYDGSGGGVGLGFSRFTNPALYYADIRKSDTGARNSRLYAGTRNGGSPDTMEMPIELSFPVTDPRKVGFTWGQTGMAIASGVSGTVLEAATPNWSERTFNFLKFDSSIGIMWHRSAVYIPRKLTAAELLARVRA